MRYSPSTRGFYVEKIHGRNIPEDAVDVTDEVYQALFADQAAGKSIVPGPDGAPIAVDQPKPDLSEFRQLMVVPRAQGLIALLRAGRLDELEEFIAQARLSTDNSQREIAIAYDNAAEWKRTSPTTAALQQVLNLSDEETDELFHNAAAIEY